MALQQLSRVGSRHSVDIVRRCCGVSTLPLASCWSKTHVLLSAPPYLGTRNVHDILNVQSTFSDYEHERRTFNITVPEKFNFARDVFDVWAAADQTGQRDGSNPALWWTDEKGNEEQFSFQTLSKLSCRVANVLTGPCQLTKGDRLIVILPRIPEWWHINLGCIRAGITVSPGTTLLRAKDIRYRLNVAKAKCIVADDSTVDFVDEVCDECPDLKHKIYVGPSSETRPGWHNFNDVVNKASESFQTADTAASETQSLFFTSGTTGSPKMTEHSHSSYGLGHLITARYLLMASPKDVVWNLSDTGWAKCAWGSFFAPWLHGATIFIQNSSKFDPDDTLRVLRQYPITTLCMPLTAARVLVKQGLSDFKSDCLRHVLCAGEPVVLMQYPVSILCMPPTAYRALVKHGLSGFKPKSLRHVLAGGEAMNPELMEEWRKHTGLDIHEAYGQTETTLLCGRYPCIEYRPGSMGKAAPGVDLQIVDEKGVPVERGKEGMVGVRYRPQRPVGLFTRYMEDPERTQSVFQGDFYLTGDRGYMDEDGYFFFVGRDDDVIVSAGYRIGPFEVESALIEHPGVLESAVVSSPDEKRGTVVKAFVTLTEAYQSSDREKLTAELQDHVKDVTAPYKYPRKIEFVDELPKTISGKIRRVELRDREWNDYKE